MKTHSHFTLLLTLQIPACRSQGQGHRQHVIWIMTSCMKGLITCISCSKETLLIKFDMWFSCFLYMMYLYCFVCGDALTCFLPLFSPSLWRPLFIFVCTYVPTFDLLRWWWLLLICHYRMFVCFRRRSAARRRSWTCWRPATPSTQRRSPPPPVRMASLYG